MNVVSLNGHVFDVDEVISKERLTAGIAVTFRNGDKINLAWRDYYEKAEICRVLGLPMEATTGTEAKSYVREAQTGYG